MSKQHSSDFEMVIKSARRTWLQLTKQDAVASVYDTFDALGFETKTGLTPVLSKKIRTDYGWRLIWRLPPGIASKSIAEKLDAFEEQVDGNITLKAHGPNLFMDIVNTPLPVKVPYSWEPPKFGYLPVPIGVAYNRMIEVDLAGIPHLFVAGNTDSGKTTFMRSLAISAFRQGAAVAIVDLKFGMDYQEMERAMPIATEEDSTRQLLALINSQMRRRADRLKQAGVSKLQDYPGKDLPWIVLIIDELAEIDNESLKLLDRILRLGRAPGISVVAATQRPAHDILPKFSNLRMLFAGRLAFSLPKQEDSRLLLGNSMASKIPRNTPGRAIWQYETEGEEVQCLFMTGKDAKLHLKGLPQKEEVFSIEPQRRLPPR